MTNKLVRGCICTGKEINSDTKVLYLPCNVSQLNMALLIAEKSSHKSYIFSGNHDVKIRDYLSKNFDSKISFFMNLNSAASFLPVIDKVVIFVGSITPFLPFEINKILSVCLEVRKDIIELPHGLFQSGHNLSDDSNLIHTSSFTEGFGGMLPSVTKRKLSWLGHDGIGYPRFHDDIKVLSRVMPKFTLITSNTNWYLYSFKDKRRFYKEVFSYAERNASEIFIWCPHNAELSINSFSKAVSEFRPRNVLLYGLDNDIYFNGIEGTDDLIPYCDYAISTVSTCLLDYEINQKRVNIFTCSGVDALHAGFVSKHCFTSSEEISANICEIKTGLLRKFDPHYFDELLAIKVDDSELIQHQYLSAFLN